MRGFNGAARFCVRKFDLHRPLGLTDFQLQWGRTFLRAEIEEMIYQAYREAGGFNGAARFCVRKSCGAAERKGEGVYASMGPHVFACGNRAPHGGHTIPGEGASMGPHVFACGNPRTWPCHSHRSLRFNGAARFCVRKFSVACGPSSAFEASMGPHVFACGNEAT